MFEFLRRNKTARPHVYGPPPLSPATCSKCMGYGFEGAYETQTFFHAEVGSYSVQEWKPTDPFQECPHCIHGIRKDAVQWTRGTEL